MDWNYADIYEAVARTIPDTAGQVQGDRTVSWQDFDRRADSVAANLLDAGLRHQSKVAVYMRNGPEFLEAYAGCLKAGLVPLNVNFRYGPDELVHVFDNGDVEAVIFHTRYGKTLERCRERVPRLRHFLAVEDGWPVPGWSGSYAAAARAGAKAAPAWPRTGEDTLLLYTGGTTGLPKGVVWRQNDVITALGGAANFYQERPPVESLGELVDRVDRTGKRLYVACPMAHATGLFTSLSLMNEGWAIETSPLEHFDPAALWCTVTDHKVTAIVIVGDAFARPMLAELATHPDEYDVSSLEIIISAGSVWSKKVRAGLIERIPWVTLCDNYGSSEALRGVQTYSRPGDVPDTGVIATSERLQMVDEQLQLLDISKPGTRGALVISGHLAVGYYKDPERSAKTWVEIAGARRCVTGDHGLVEPDGTIRLLGRGNAVVNTGGEKVYPQEVEDVLRLHETVSDAAVIGLPDERFGQVVTALVAHRPGKELDPAVLTAHVKGHLAGYKAPRYVILVASIPHTAAGKIDYNACHALARREREAVPVHEAQ